MTSQRHKLADELFAAGKFPEAEPIFCESLDTLPVAAQRLGQIALLANRCDEAEQWFARVAADSPFFPAAQHALGELHYRRGDYPRAARYFHGSGRTALAEKLARFGAAPPYAAVHLAAESDLELVATAPLPVVRIQVNGLDTYMVLDTGTGETVLDVDFAEDVAAVATAFATDIFAGGQAGMPRHGRVDRLGIGAMELANVPVQIGGVRGVFAPFFPMPIEGIIGIGLLRRFFVTLDIAAARLTLRREARPLDADDATPFWLTDDEHVIAWGSINRSHPVLMFIDTGQTGFHFAAPPSTLQAAQIAEQEPWAGYRQGGGSVNAVPFQLEQVALGAAAVHNALGALEPRFPLERRYGFRIGGLLAYDFFRQFVVSFDFAAMRLYLHAATADAAIVQK